MVKNKAAVALGRRGGKAFVEKHGQAGLKELSRKGVEARQRKRLESKKCDINTERVCPKDWFKYQAGGICSCWR